MVADVDADRSDQDAEQKRNAPAPRVQVRSRHPRCEPNAEQGRQHLSQALAGKLPTCNEPAAAGRMLHQKSRRTAEFAAGRKTLDQAGGENSDRRHQTNGLVARHDGDRQRAGGHQNNGDHQRGFAAMAVGIGTQYDAADRANEKGQSEGAEGQEQRNRRIAIGEKCPGNINGEIAIRRDVIPFQRVSDRDRNNEPGETLFPRGFRERHRGR